MLQVPGYRCVKAAWSHSSQGIPVGSLSWQPLTFFYTTGSITLRLYKIMSKKWTETLWKRSWTTIYLAKPETSEVSLHLLQQQSTSMKGTTRALLWLVTPGCVFWRMRPCWPTQTLSRADLHKPYSHAIWLPTFCTHIIVENCLMINSDMMPTSGWQRRMLSMSLPGHHISKWKGCDF